MTPWASLTQVYDQLKLFQETNQIDQKVTRSNRILVARRRAPRQKDRRRPKTKAYRSKFRSNYRQGPSRPNRGSSSQNQRQRLQCYNCGGNHVEKECKMPCKICGSKHHTRYGCPQKRTQSSRYNDRRNGNQEQGKHATKLHVEAFKSK